MTCEEFKIQMLPLSGGMYRIAFHYLEDEDAARDAVQEIFMKLWSSRDKLESISNIQAYCHTLIRNHCIDRIRRESRKVDGEVPDRPGAPPGDIQDTKETLRKTLELMNELPERQREILRLRVFEDQEYDKIARTLGMTEINVRVQLSLARKALKQKLNAYERAL